MTTQNIYSFSCFKGNSNSNNYLLCCINNLVTKELCSGLPYVNNVLLLDFIKNVYVNILYSFGVRFNTIKKIFV